METPERKAYRRAWAKKKYHANPEKHRKARVKSYQNETREQRENRLEKGRQYRLANKEKLRKLNAAWRAKNKEKTRDNNLRRVGWSSAQYDAVMIEQDFKCAICGIDLLSLPPKQRHADHCHNTGKARGILCGGCNSGLGLFKDNTTALRAAANYLEER